MLSAFKNVFKIKDLRSKILYTLAMIAVVRLIQNVPVPGIDLDMLDRAMKDLENSAGGGLLQMFNVFSGGALQNFAIGVLGIMPYITASIILQLMTPVIPQIEKNAKRRRSGTSKIYSTNEIYNNRYLSCSGFLPCKRYAYSSSE